MTDERTDREADAERPSEKTRPTEHAPRSAGSDARRNLVPVSELIDLEALRAETGRDPTPARLRAALPRGWALADDHQHAYPDARLLFREGWILILGLVVFGSVGLGFLWGAMPRGWGGIARFVLLIGVVALLGGVVAPAITRALNRR